MPIRHPRPLHHAVRALLLAAAISLPAVLAACSGDAKAKEAEPPQPPEFVGTIVYETSAGGTNKDGAEMFRAMGPKREAVTWGGGGRLRLETEGGMLEGITVARLADSMAFLLDTAEHVARRAMVEGMNPDDVVPEMREWVAANFGPPETTATGEERTIAGHRCRVYSFSKTRLLRWGATARACITDSFRTPPVRNSFKTEDGSTRMTALPLQYGLKEGLPLWVEVNEQGTLVTYTAVSLTPGQPADSLFSVPAGYTVQEKKPAN